MVDLRLLSFLLSLGGLLLGFLDLLLGALELVAKLVLLRPGDPELLPVLVLREAAWLGLYLSLFLGKVFCQHVGHWDLEQLAQLLDHCSDLCPGFGVLFPVGDLF